MIKNIVRVNRKKKLMVEIIKFESQKKINSFTPKIMKLKKKIEIYKSKIPMMNYT